MSAALSIATSGLQSASARFDSAARSVVQSDATDSGGPAPQQQSNSPQAPERRSATPSANPVFETNDLASGLSDVKLAEASYKAQVAVLKAVNEIERETVDLLT